MNNSNPLIPQGSLLEQKAKAKPHLRVAYVIVAVHLVFLGGLLIQGCKKEDQTVSKTGGMNSNESILPPLDSSNLYASNLTEPATNPLVASNLDATNPFQTQTLPPQNPTPTPAPAAQQIAPSTETQEYAVLQGDSFYTIGKKFGVSISAIAKANPGVDSTRLKIGQKLVIPAPSSPVVAAASISNSAENVHTVKSGDTLIGIAKANGTTVSEIKTLNGLTTDRIKVGQKIKLPAPKNVAPAGTLTPTPPPSGGPGNL